MAGGSLAERQDAHQHGARQNSEARAGLATALS